MTFCTNDLQTAQILGFLIQLNIGTTACHVGSNSNGTMNTCIRNDLSLQLMELGIQDFMRNALFSQHLA